MFLCNGFCPSGNFLYRDLFKTVLWIQMILVLPDPDTTLFVRIWIWILQSFSKNSKKNLYFYCFVSSLWLLSMKDNVNVSSKSNKQKKTWIIFCGFLTVTDEKSRRQIRICTKMLRIHNASLNFLCRGTSKTFHPPWQWSLTSRSDAIIGRLDLSRINSLTYSHM